MNETIFAYRADFLKFVFILLDIGTQEFSTGHCEFLLDLHFLCKIVLKPRMSYRYYYISLAERFLYLTSLVVVEA